MLEPKKTYSERGRMGAQKVNADRTPEQRKELSRHARRAGAVNTVINQFDELTPEQRERIRRVVFADQVEE